MRTFTVRYRDSRGRKSRMKVQHESVAQAVKEVDSILKKRGDKITEILNIKEWIK